jgi:hypothetical protein
VVATIFFFFFGKQEGKKPKKRDYKAIKLGVATPTILASNKELRGVG